ncbi:MAG: oligosaccharide flippase family protein [Ruminococcus sp.]
MNQKKIGVVLSYMSQGVMILSSVIYTPIMLRILGQSEYGLYTLVNSVVSYLSILSLGFTSSYMRFYSKYKADNDEKGISRLNGMFMTIFSIMSLICLICGFFMVTNIHAIFGTGLTEAEYPKATVLMVIMVINLALTFPDSVFVCQINANERFFFLKVLTFLKCLLNPFICLPLLILGYGSVAMVCVSTLFTVVTLILHIIYAFKKLKTKFSFRGFKFREFREMWSFTFFIFLNQIIDQLNWSVDKLILGRILGTVSVAVYGVGSTIQMYYQQFSGTVSSVFAPQVNRIVAENKDSKVMDRELTCIMTKVGRVQALILFLILSGFILFGQEFLTLWAGEKYANSYYVAMLLMLPSTVPFIQGVGIEIQRAKNKHQVRSVIYAIIAAINVVISIPLCYYFHEIGAAFGTTLAMVVGNIIFMNIYYHKGINLDMFYYWKNIAQLIKGLVPCVLIAVIALQFVTINNWIEMFIAIGIYCVIYFVSMWFLSMNDFEKNMFRNKFKRFGKRGSE